MTTLREYLEAHPEGIFQASRDTPRFTGAEWLDGVAAQYPDHLDMEIREEYVFDAPANQGYTYITYPLGSQHTYGITRLH